MAFTSKIISLWLKVVANKKMIIILYNVEALIKIYNYLSVLLLRSTSRELKELTDADDGHELTLLVADDDLVISSADWSATPDSIDAVIVTTSPTTDPLIWVWSFWVWFVTFSSNEGLL